MPRITELYAYVVADSGPDDEGIPAFLDSAGMWMPMVGADMDRACSLRERAQEIANLHGKDVRLIRSTGIEVVETISAEKGMSPDEVLE